MDKNTAKFIGDEKSHLTKVILLKMPRMQVALRIKANQKYVGGNATDGAFSPK